MPRNTKIVATLGPATSDPEVLSRMLAAGVDVVRLNFSHGTSEDHVRRARNVRAAAQALAREVGIMADLQGPKIRVGKFKDAGRRFDIREIYRRRVLQRNPDDHPSQALDDILAALDVPRIGRHTAIGDATAVALAFLGLKYSAPKRVARRPGA